MNQPASDTRLGYILALSSYGFWGVLPIYWKLLGHVSTIEVVAHRAVWSLVFVGAWLWLKGGLGQVRAAFAQRRAMQLLALSAAILFVNWGAFIWAIHQGYALESSFAYFINPLMSVALGFVLLGERLNRAQTVAIGLAAIAVLAQGFVMGAFPFLSVFLAGTFAIYGYIRKICAVRAGPANLIESLLHVLPASAILVAIEGGAFMGDAGTAFLLMLAGPVTAVPLIAFAAAAQRLPLTTMGLLQFVVPSGHFLLALTVFGQELSIARLMTFVVIWIALLIFAIDIVRRQRRPSS